MRVCTLVLFHYLATFFCCPGNLLLTRIYIAPSESTVGCSTLYAGNKMAVHMDGGWSLAETSIAR